MNVPISRPDWETVRFGDVVKNANLTERDPIGAGIDRIVGLEHLDPESLHIRRWNPLGDGTSFTRKFIPGQTLFGKRRAYQRKVAFAEFEGICSGDILTFEPKDPKMLLPELLPFICQTDAFFDHALGTSAGSLSPRTSYKALQDFEFPLPPTEEQKCIAEILWAADEVATHYLELEQRLDTLFQVTMAEHFPSRSNTDGVFIELGKLCARQPQSGLYKGADFIGHGVKTVKMGELFSNDLIAEDVEMERMDLTPGEVEKYSLTSNDLLFGRRSIVLEGAGRCSMVGDLVEPTIFESSILRVTINPAKALSEYVYCWFRSPEGMKEIRRIRSFTTVAGITGSDLKKVRVPLVPLAQQESVARKLFDHRAQVALIERTKAEATAVMKTLNEFLVSKNACV